MYKLFYNRIYIMIPSRNKKYDINYLNENDINNNKCTFENLEKISPFLNKNTAETYKIYLASNPNLGETVKEFYLNLIKRIEDNEKKYIEKALLILEDVTKKSN